MSEKRTLKPKIALYARTSTSYQRKGLDSQISKLEKYAEARDIPKGDIILFRDEDISGSKFSRPEFNKLLEGVKKGEINTVITCSMSRISRSLRDLLDLAEVFDKHNVSFISLTESIDTSTPAGRLIYSILGAVGQFEREVISERVKRGLEKAKSDGKRLGREKTRNSELIQELRRQGLTYQEISKRAKCSIGSVQAELKKAK